MVNSYFSIHNHTDLGTNTALGFPDTICRVPDLIQKAYDYGLSGVSISDHESISAHIQALKYYNSMARDHPFTLALGNEIYLMEEEWDRAFYEEGTWKDEDSCILYGIPDWSYEELIPYKWAEIDLSEVGRMDIPVIEIIHSKDGAYDVYINSQWQVTRSSIDNVLQHLADYIGTFTLKFKDLTLYKE